MMRARAIVLGTMLCCIGPQSGAEVIREFGFEAQPAAYSEVSVIGRHDDVRMTDTEFESLSCAVAGTGAVAIAGMAGTLNLVQVIAGGVVAPVGPGAFAVGLFGVLFGSFCGIAQQAAPAIRYFLEQWNGEPVPVRGP